MRLPFWMHINDVGYEPTSGCGMKRELNSRSGVVLKELYDFLDAMILVQTDAEVLNQPT
jgi:hypothetical protein